MVFLFFPLAVGTEERVGDWNFFVCFIYSRRDPTPSTIHPLHNHNHSAVLGSGGVDVKIFSISAKLALDAKLAAKPHHPSVGPAADAWQRSRFGPLQAYLDSILTDEEKVDVCGWV